MNYSIAARTRLSQSNELLGKKIEAIVQGEPNLHVYSLATQNEKQRDEVSHLITKLRSTQTRQEEFTYYIQRAYELLFKQVFVCSYPVKRNYMPELGDAGDRLNGLDIYHSRNLIQLIADYGSNISLLYRRQIHCIEQSVLG